MRSPLIQKQSRWAGPSQFCAFQALPLLVLAIVGHRQGWFDTPILFYLLFLVALTALAACVFGVMSLWSIWQEGELGTRKSVVGVSLGALILVPFVIAGSMVLTIPKINDVTTRYAPEMEFDAVRSMHVVQMNDLTPASLQQVTRQFDLYPDIAARQFAIPPEPLFEALQELIAARGWRVLESIAPDGALAGGRIEAIAYSPVLAIPTAILIETAYGANRTRVDFRAAALWAEHDMGANVDRLFSFFHDLDIEIRGIREDGVAIYDDDQVSEPLPLNIPRPRPR